MEQKALMWYAKLSALSVLVLRHFETGVAAEVYRNICVRFIITGMLLSVL
jgi:hypothetical protein